MQQQRTMVTTWAAFAEGMYLSGDRGGWHSQARLWSFVRSGQLKFADPGEPGRLADLMERYRNVPMDLADASLMAVAADQGHRQVFTLDDDFDVYRLPNGERLEVLP